MIEMAFAGFAITLANGKHVRVTLIFDKVPRKVQNVLWVIISLVTTFYICIVTYAVTRLAFSSLTLGCVTSTSEIPFFPWQIVAALGLTVFLMALVIFTAKRIAIALGRREESKEEERLIDVDHRI
jgi:TRAP-type C4-dicarboxylate transport system permease small subunit